MHSHGLLCFDPTSRHYLPEESNFKNFAESTQSVAGLSSGNHWSLLLMTSRHSEWDGLQVPLWQSPSMRIWQAALWVGFCSGCVSASRLNCISQVISAPSHLACGSWKFHLQLLVLDDILWRQLFVPSLSDCFVIRSIDFIWKAFTDKLICPLLLLSYCWQSAFSLCQRWYF